MSDNVLAVRPFTSNPAVRVPLGTTLSLPNFNTAAVDLELGCGTGMFALDYAKTHVNRHLIAVEQTVNRFSTFNRTFRKQSLPNLTPIHADGALWVDRYLPATSIERLYILYPNPYPKKKQQNLRWHYMPAMHSILRALKPASPIQFCTNLKWLVDEAAIQFSAGWKLELESVREIKLGARPPLTLFEKKYLERGEVCFDLRLRTPPA